MWTQTLLTNRALPHCTFHVMSPVMMEIMNLHGQHCADLLFCRHNLLWGSCFLSNRHYLFMVSLTQLHYTSLNERSRSPFLSFAPSTEPTVLPTIAAQGKNAIPGIVQWYLCDTIFWHLVIFAVSRIYELKEIFLCLNNAKQSFLPVLCLHTFVNDVNLQCPKYPTVSPLYSKSPFAVLTLALLEAR